MKTGVLKKIDGHLVSLLNPASFEADQYRMLRHKIEWMRFNKDVSVCAVSSPTLGDGKTTTAINLAGALAQACEVRVLLIDADLRLPSVGAKLGLADYTGFGLVDLVRDPGLPLEKAVQRLHHFNLSVLLAGNSQASPYELLKSPRLGELLEQAKKEYDYILLDTPPVIPFPDCPIIAKLVDGFLVVVAAHRTPQKLLEEALNAMDQAKVIGLILNEDDHPIFGHYHYYYNYIHRQPHTTKSSAAQSSFQPR
jgi:capsular exopolysaccharide synthesis family protein